MATRYLRLQSLAALIGCASLLHVACGGDDDNAAPTGGTGGTGAKGGSAGKGGTGAKGGKGGSSGTAGAEGGAGPSTGGSSATGGTGGSTGATGGKGGSSAAGGKGGSTGATGGKGGTTATGGTTGNEGGTGDIGGAGNGSGATGGGCQESDLTTLSGVSCYGDCTPVTTPDSLQFLNRCSDGTQTVGGLPSSSTPWTVTLSALGAGCKRVGPGCTLPDLP
jgi:hypothetical protein